ncbi:MAG: nucleotide exchange factor GrpE [Deltaproteobacteria bacterium]|nr:nucleotide exchange factor GrpE [Deltaproteobacteria bacterium]
MSEHDEGAEGGQSIPIRRESDAEAPAAADENEVVELLAEVEFLRNRVEQLENNLADQALQISRYSVRATEAENELEKAKARIRREALKDAKKIRQDLLRDVLETVDNLERALETHASGTALSDGVKLVHHQFLKTLAGHGVVPMESEGQPFSAEFHEAVSMLPCPSPEQDGTVVAVMQKGYLVGDEVLRPARVAVGKHSS